MGTGIRTMITHFPTAEKPSATEVSRRKRRRASVLGVTRRRMLRKYTAGARRRASAPAGSGTPAQVKTTGARRSIARRSVDRLSLLLSHVSVFDRRRRLHGEPPQETARGGEKPNKEKPKNLRQPPQGLERSRQRWSLPLAETARVGNVDKKTTAKKSVKMRLRMSFPGVGLARESRQASETVKMVQTKRERRATCEYDVCYKVLVMGETSVGKSSLIARLKGGMFADNLMPTCGIDFVNQDYEIDGAKCRLQVWDTAGQERFRTITKFQFRGTKGLLLVFDMCRRDSFDMLRYWLRSLEQEDLDAEQMILLANKSDMQSERQVSRRTP
ncbi:PREDICTED: ras-related protein Rab-44-like [Priapulus caudatus]|uniref:Ras-related protein Rab-44-like n=1 Tax=Priapulus caudatus TaxID=37621 RepID=A0ABM1FA29_PRICU|nr:PREDICTED: ras-related protein Rab-44-like [Priapulus caudatus]